MLVLVIVIVIVIVIVRAIALRSVRVTRPERRASAAGLRAA
ncbi:MAG: hypothetical protein AB7N76_30785 [Planctomycetota bacterium]